MGTLPHDWQNQDWDWAISIWAKNFRQEEQEEILVCDISCAVGEIGGSLGLFLGGSVLMYVDSIIHVGGRVVKRFISFLMAKKHIG